MPHHTPLIATVVTGIVLAFGMGALAHRLRLSPLVGYLLAGVAVGPFTPGYVADLALAGELAEIGVILLMFGVGLHFSFKELLSVRTIAVPGAIAQITVATLMGIGLAWLTGWTLAAGFVFGLALSVASTVVLLRALQERRIVETERGRIAVGWLIVEDLVMVLALVMIPAIADALNGTTTGAPSAAFPPGLAQALALTLGKVIAFAALMLVIGRRIVPWVLHYIAHTGSRELFRLCVLAVALGVAYGASTLFGVSFALGAFFAGMILSESALSQRAAEETLPLRDAFAVLFFVSVGMLFDPTIILRDFWPVLGTVAIILIGKSAAALVIVRAFGRSMRTALTISASLAQIGEFSFILAGLGVSLKLLPEAGRDLILAGALLSILLNPFLFTLIDRLAPARDPARAAAEPTTEPPEPDLHPTGLTGHAVVIGYGRVGSLVGAGLKSAGRDVLVIEEAEEPLTHARSDGAEVIIGNAANARVLNAAGLDRAEQLFIAIPGAFEAGQIARQARAINPNLEILARAHSDAEVTHLLGNGATLAIMGEREIARGMLEHAGNLSGDPLAAAPAWTPG